MLKSTISASCFKPSFFATHPHSFTFNTNTYNCHIFRVANGAGGMEKREDRAKNVLKRENRQVERRMKCKDGKIVCSKCLGNQDNEIVRIKFARCEYLHVEQMSTYGSYSHAILFRWTYFIEFFFLFRKIGNAILYSWSPGIFCGEHFSLCFCTISSCVGKTNRFKATPNA